MKYKKMPLELKVYITWLHQDKGTRICELEKQFSEYLMSSIYRAANEKLAVQWKIKSIKTKGNLGS